MRIYMDNAATTPLRQEVIAAMANSLEFHFGNPSSIHADGRLVRAAIESARKTVASRLNASIGEIFFTSGGTESSNMAIKCAVRDLDVTRIISSPTEHHCVLHTLAAVEREGVEILMLDVDRRGHVDYGKLEAWLAGDAETKTLVSLMHANNEIGTLHDLSQIASLCQQHGALFHTDTVQTIGHLPIDLSRIRIDFLTGGAHKFHGPKGCGFIYINGENRIKPWIDGGSQERNMRGGTENVAGIVGMACALDLACEHLEEYRAHIEDLRAYFIQRLEEEYEDIQFNGDYDGQYLYTILSVSFPPSPTSDLMLLQLDIEGVSASGGSACSSGAEAGSHVLQAIGAAEGRKSIRFSFSHYNTRQEVDLVIEKLGKWVKRRS
jgi:cysteine desulfurase